MYKTVRRKPISDSNKLVYLEIAQCNVLFLLFALVICFKPAKSVFAVVF